jgi:hypothetical protein
MRNPQAANQRRFFPRGGGLNAPVTMVDLNTMAKRFELHVESLRSEMASTVSVLMKDVRDALAGIQSTVHI